MFVGNDNPMSGNGADRSRGGSESRINSVYLANKIIGYILVVSVFGAIAGMFLYLKGTQAVPDPNEPSLADLTKKEIDPGGNLPDLATSSSSDGGGVNNHDFESIEGLLYSNFYQKRDIKTLKTLKEYRLPINIKTDTANYYDISRKVNLDPYLEGLNNRGFAMVDGKAFSNGDDFYDYYRDLLKADYPIVITEDFVLYQYQNILKDSFKEIEKSVFYENLWDISKRMFDISFIRYKQRMEEVGQSGDVILEAARMEASYFAVVLKLLEPIEGQINKTMNFSDENKFTEQEANTYSFDLPDYFDASAINKEVENIRKAATTEKSSILFYPIDYKNYKISKNDKENAKLNNFYLAKKWLNQSFPLEYKSDSCPDCTLDRDDWRINFAASLLLANDFYDNKEVKNRWAVIYKIISYFSGLRKDLTFLDYSKALESYYGSDYENIAFLKLEGGELDSELERIKSGILEKSFSDIEGGYDRQNPAERQFLGFRLLQDPFWPNNYLFSVLTGKDMLKAGKQADAVTACAEKRGNVIYRCSGFGMDVMSLLKPGEYGDYYAQNTGYSGYKERQAVLIDKFKAFDKSTWNNNVYWSTLDIASGIMNAGGERRPVYAQSIDWNKDRDINTALGSWVNLHLPQDIWENFIESEAVNSFSSGYYCNLNNYVEPNLQLYYELVTKNDMLLEMFKALGVTDKTVAANNNIKDFNKKLQTMISISEREIGGGALSEDDCKDIKTFAKNYQVKGELARSFAIVQGSGRISESISGMKAVMLVYRNGSGKNVMAVGPIFNYFEKK